jgi:hypothetical protein
VSENTLEAPPVPAAGTSQRPRSASAWAPFALVRRYPWGATGFGLVAFSVVFVLVTGTRPGYDPYGWLIWGYQTVHGSLDLGGAPSWKPLPYFFTVPFALFGHYELWLWMFTSVTISLSGAIFAGRIAYRLVGAGDDGDRRPAWFAALFAGACLLGIEDYMHFVLSMQADTMIVSLCLGSIDMALSGHPRWAFALGVLAGLGRPESWSWLLPWTIWMWFKRPDLRKLFVGGWLFILFMWFGIPTITNNRPFLAEQLALSSPRELHENKIVGTFHRFTELQWIPIQLAAIATTIVAWFRTQRNWVILWLAVAVVDWVAVETILVLRGLPGVPRYMFEAAGVMTVIAAVGVGWLLREAPTLASKLSRPRLPKWWGVAAVAVLSLIMVPAAVSRLRAEHKDLYHERGRTQVINMLQGSINHFGGYKHIRWCGEPVTTVEYVSVLAYDTKLNVGSVGYILKREIRHGYPLVNFIPTSSVRGWALQPIHTKPSKAAACGKLNAAWVDPSHPHQQYFPPWKPTTS